MSFSKFIENLQNKPRHTRVKIMWLAVFVCMLIIVTVWFWSLNSTVGAINKSSNKPKIPDDLSQSINQFKKDVPTLWGSLKDGIKNLENEQ